MKDLRNVEDHVERQVERKMDALDRRLLEGKIGHDDYIAEIREIDAWASRTLMEAGRK